MVLQAMPYVRATEDALKGKKGRVIFFTPHGKQFTNDMAREIAKEGGDIVFLSGHYEGLDARAKDILNAEEISIGPYILTGGELPAMTVMDSISRQIEGVLGNFNSLEESRVSSSEVYTRPEVLEYKNKKYLVPKLLLSDDDLCLKEALVVNDLFAHQQSDRDRKLHINLIQIHHDPKGTLGILTTEPFLESSDFFFNRTHISFSITLLKT